MKRNAIIRIVIYSILTLILVSALVIGIAGSVYSFSTHTGDFVEGSAAIDAGNVSSIHIEWAAGSISIVPENTEEILVTEYGTGIGEYTMVTECRGGVLTVCYSENSVIGIGTTSVPEKNLVISVPVEWICDELTIEAADADIEITRQTIDRFNLDCAAGDCVLTDCQVNEMDIDTASCNLTFSGTLTKMDCDGASACLTLVCYNVPDSIDLDGVSADLDLTLPESCGFRVVMDGLNSHFSSDFGHVNRGGAYCYGDEDCQIDVDGVSAGVYIHCESHHEEAHHH